MVETKKFPVLEGEDDELANERMYGKADAIGARSRMRHMTVHATARKPDDMTPYLK